MRRMTRYIFLLLTIISACLDTSAQTKTIHVGIYDMQTKLPVSDVHVFMASATYGDISNDKGVCKFDIPSDMDGELIFSHISYDPLFFNKEKYSSLNPMDSIFLIPNGVKIEEILIKEKRDKNWKKNFNLFKAAFLGQDKASKKCEILNPEVLRFKNDDNEFTTSAVDMIRVRNEYLGYDIDFLLIELSISGNGTIKYHGHPKFTDISTSSSKRKKILKRRKQTYERSSKHFFASLINDKLEENNYQVRTQKLENGIWRPITIPARADLLKKVKDQDKFIVVFDEFLQVTNTKIKNTEISNLNLSVGDKRQFGGGGGKSSTIRTRYAISQLYKIAPYLLLDTRGNVINNRSLQEYGYWADMRMASTLPWDYGYDMNKILSSPIAISNNEFQIFKELTNSDKSKRNTSINYIKNNWKNEFVPPILDVIRIVGDEPYMDELISLLKSKTNNNSITSYYEGLQWVWENNPGYPSFYSDYKAHIYKNIDPSFAEYFEGRQKDATISLDEVVWGGVKKDGIPPLRNPSTLSAAEADYLRDDDIIFGINIDGIAKAYPKRILAWHELFIDQFGDKEIAGVYCTLCGTVIPYETHFEGKHHELGTSGFLYRSNKLMYDKASNSLWNTINGEPVIGPLSNKNIKLFTHPVVTTTWGEWKKNHPNTLVLDIETGYDRDYDEGVAYQEYFTTDKLMFPVPKQSNKLRNKDEVFIIRTANYAQYPTAFSTTYLKENSITQDTIGNIPIIILTDGAGQSRAYNRSTFSFVKYKNNTLQEDSGTKWVVHDEGIISPLGVQLKRLPAHRIFWFACYNAYPDTKLIH